MLAFVCVAGCRNDLAPAQAGALPEVALLTSLPIAFSQDFALDAPKHPLMMRLEQEYRVRLVDGPEQLQPGGLLLAVQPQALTAERLVALDRWVRAGGRMLLLADPRFVWDSGRPLGERSRPPFAYQDTGLLAHWGLALSVGQDGPAVRQLGGAEVLTGSPGALSAQPRSSCEVSRDELVARCRIGQGTAVVVADADLVQVDVPGGLDGPTAQNHPAIVAQLRALER